MKKPLYGLSCLVFSCILLFSACSPEEKPENSEPPSTPPRAESSAPGLPKDDGTSSQPSTTVDAPKPTEPLLVNTVSIDTARGIQRYGYAVMRDDTVYLFAEGRRSIYSVKGEIGKKLYEIPRRTTLMSTLSEWEGICI